MTPEESILVADRTVLMKDVLEEVGYDLWKFPLQISCPVHNLGKENHPSARIYSEQDHTVWCFYCFKQYWPTEVWEAQKSLDRSDAALDLLKRWPVSPDRAQALVRLVRAPVRESHHVVFHSILNRHLEAHRGRAQFEGYRIWARRVDEFAVYLDNLGEEFRESAIQSFCQRLDTDLVSTYQV